MRDRIILNCLSRGMDRRQDAAWNSTAERSRRLTACSSTKSTHGPEAGTIPSLRKTIQRLFSKVFAGQRSVKPPLCLPDMFARSDAAVLPALSLTALEWSKRLAGIS